MTGPRLLDVNVLLALSWNQHIHHRRAHEAFRETGAWSTTPATETGLIRLLLTEVVVGRVVTAGEALAQLASLRRVPGWSWIDDDASPATWIIGTDALRGRRQVTDLHLLNLAVAHGATLATFDAGIRRSLRPAERHFVEVW